MNLCPNCRRRGAPRDGSLCVDCQNLVDEHRRRRTAESSKGDKKRKT